MTEGKLEKLSQYRELRSSLRALLYLINEILVERIYNDYFQHLDVISN